MSNATETSSLMCKCRQGRVIIFFVPKAGTDAFQEVKEGSVALLKIAAEVRIKIKHADKKERAFSARFTPAECVELLGDTWPNDESFDRIARSVRERKIYPPPKPEIPGGGGKSHDAQGQTKKPDSHSHDKHK